MTPALGPLIEEHQQIRTVIAAMVALIDRTQGGEGLSPLPFVRLQDFIERFADGSHHAKEEQVLFPELTQAGLRLAPGVLSGMFGDHERARKYADVIGAAARACLAGEGRHEPQMVEATRAWCRLTALHLATEDETLYAIAPGVLGPARLAQLEARLAAVDPSPAALFVEAAERVVEAAAAAATAFRRHAS